MADEGLDEIHLESPGSTTNNNQNTTTGDDGLILAVDDPSQEQDGSATQHPTELQKNNSSVHVLLNSTNNQNRVKSSEEAVNDFQELEELQTDGGGDGGGHHQATAVRGGGNPLALNRLRNEAQNPMGESAAATSIFVPDSSLGGGGGAGGYIPAELAAVPVTALGDDDEDFDPSQLVENKGGDDDDEEPTRLRRGGNRKSKEIFLVKPFFPDPELKYLEKDFTSISKLLFFEDQEIQAEFNRYMMRDVSILIAGSMVALGSIGYGLVFIDIGPTYFWVNMVVGLLASPIIMTDFYLHFFKPNTRKFSKYRTTLQFTLALIATIPTCWVPFNTYSNQCQTAVDVLAPLGLPRPELTPERIQWSCREVHFSFSIAQVTAVLLSFPLHPILIGILFAVAGLLQVTTRYGIPHPMEPSGDLGAKHFIFFCFSVITFLFALTRYRASMESFIMTVHIERAVQEIERVIASVDVLLCAMLPSSALVRLCNYEAIADFTPAGTVLLADMVQFTRWSSTRTPEQIVEMLNYVCVQFDLLTERAGAEKIKTIGDAYWVVVGLPEPVKRHAEVGVDLGVKLLKCLRELNTKYTHWGNIQMRCGVHTGRLYGGILGTQQLTYEVYGETNRLAGAAESNGKPGHVTATRDVLAALRIVEDSIEGVERIHFPHPDRPHTEEVTAFVLLEDTSVKSHRLLSKVGPTADNRSVGDRSEEPSHDGLSGVGSEVSVDGKKHRALSKREALRRRQKFITQRTQMILLQRDDALVGSGGDSTPNNSSSQKPQKLTAANLEKQEAHLNTHEGMKENALRDLETAFNGRKYKNLWYDFADEEIEVKYKEWVTGRQWTQRLYSRIALLLFIVILVASLFIEGSELPGITWISIAVAIILGLADLILVAVARPSRRSGRTSSKVPVAATCALMHFTSVVILIGLGATVPRGTAVLTNDTAYLHPMLAMLCGIGSVGPISAGTIFLANFLILLNVTNFLTTDSVMQSANFALLGQVTAVLYFFFVVMEKQYRRQFADIKISEFLIWEQNKMNLEQEVLLSSMVPAHVIPSLKVWMFEREMNPAFAPRKSFTKLAVAFVQIRDPDSMVHSGLTTTSSVVKKSGGKKGGDAAGKNNGNATVNPAALLLENSAAGGGESSSETGSADSMNHNVPESENRMADFAKDGEEGDEFDGFEDADQYNQEQREGEDHQFGWLAPAHTRIDHILRKFPALDKVKTIGEQVMIAGPLQDDKFTINEALDQIMACSAMINKDVAAVQIGIHTGEILGSTVGTNRICFDIFGDAVNVASRTMTGAKPGQTRVTEEFYQDYTDAGGQSIGTSQTQHQYSDGCVFSDPEKAAAKGKGIINVRRVIKGVCHEGVANGQASKIGSMITSQQNASNSFFESSGLAASNSGAHSFSLSAQIGLSAPIGKRANQRGKIMFELRSQQ